MDVEGLGAEVSGVRGLRFGLGAGYIHTSRQTYIQTCYCINLPVYTRHYEEGFLRRGAQDFGGSVSEF